MKATSVIKVADGMTVILNYWRYGLHRSAAAKVVKLVTYTVKLLVYHRWDYLLLGYLKYLWIPERRIDDE